MSRNFNSVSNALREKLIETGSSASDADQIAGQMNQIPDLEKLNPNLLLITVLVYKELANLEDIPDVETVSSTIQDQLSRRWEDWKSVPNKNRLKLTFEILAFLFKIDQEFPSSRSILPE